MEAFLVWLCIPILNNSSYLVNRPSKNSRIDLIQTLNWIWNLNKTQILRYLCYFFRFWGYLWHFCLLLINYIHKKWKSIISFRHIHIHNPIYTRNLQYYLLPKKNMVKQTDHMICIPIHNQYCCLIIDSSFSQRNSLIPNQRFS